VYLLNTTACHEPSFIALSIRQQAPDSLDAILRCFGGAVFAPFDNRTNVLDTPLKNPFRVLVLPPDLPRECPQRCQRQE
jgi:hypothetical protein